MPHIQILLAFVILVCGSAALALTVSIKRRYPLPFLSSYLIFLSLFNLYFFLQTVLDYIFVNIVPRGSVILSYQINTYTDLFFSATLLFITWLAMKLIFNLGGLAVPRWLSSGFAAVAALSLIINIVLILTLPLVSGSHTLYLIMLTNVLLFHLAIVIALLQLAFGISAVNTERQSALLRLIVVWGLLIKGLSLLGLALYSLGLIRFNISFFAIFLIFNLIPIFGLRRLTETLFLTELLQIDQGPPPDLSGLCSRYSISKREQEIIELVLTGCSNRDIEERLFISHATVKDHIYKIYKKTGVRNRVQLTNLFRN